MGIPHRTQSKVMKTMRTLMANNIHHGVQPTNIISIHKVSLTLQESTASAFGTHDIDTSYSTISSILWEIPNRTSPTPYWCHHQLPCWWWWPTQTRPVQISQPMKLRATMFTNPSPHCATMIFFLLQCATCSNQCSMQTAAAMMAINNQTNQSRPQYHCWYHTWQQCQAKPMIPPLALDNWLQMPAPYYSSHSLIGLQW